MRLGAKLLAPPLVVLTLAAGLWFWSGVVAPEYWSTIGLGVAWFVAASVIFGKVTKSWPQLRWWVRGPFLACSAAAAFGFYWTSIRDTVVDERNVQGVKASELPAATVDPLAPQTPAPAAAAPAPAQAPKRNVVEREGAVTPASHSASGRVRVVRLAAGGRRLTLSDSFEIDPGPQVRVYLATDEGGRTFKDLGALKGSKGDQQYTIASGTELARYDTVVFWCVPFSQALAHATLAPA